MAIRSTLPWPVRWVLGALVLGFSAAIALWAFEFGRGLAGLDGMSRKELGQLQEELVRLRKANDEHLTRVNVADSLMAMERAEKDKLQQQVQQLEDDNQALRDDLGFFQKLTQAGNSETVSIRALQGELISPQQLKWQLLIMQNVRNPPAFEGRLELTLSGTRQGQAWSMPLPSGGQSVQLAQYKRIEGIMDVPADVQLKSITARLSQGKTTRSVQTVKLM